MTNHFYERELLEQKKWKLLPEYSQLRIFDRSLESEFVFWCEA